MFARTVLITGCNRGIGLGLVKQFVEAPDCQTLIATCRDKAAAPELTALETAAAGRLTVLELDVTKHESYPKFLEQVESLVGDAGLSLLINNAGFLPRRTGLDDVTPDDLRQAFEINCVAPLFLARLLLPLVKRAAKANSEEPLSVSKAAIIQMSTAVASIAENDSGSRTGGYAYRCSKSALNMTMKTLAVDLHDTGILVMSMHPGWVQTDMGGPNALINVETCCKTMVETLEKLGPSDHGAFKRYNNTPIPW